MNVISENNEVFNASVSVQTIERHFGLVMESRSGTKNSVNERNTDYLLALEVILLRLFKLNIGAIKVFLVSRKAFTIWSSMAERVLEIENSTDIKLSSSAETLRKLFLVPLLDSITSPKCRSIVCTDTEALKTSLFSEITFIIFFIKLLCFKIAS
jgi:hypothetical protein